MKLLARLIRFLLIAILVAVFGAFLLMEVFPMLIEWHYKSF